MTAPQELSTLALNQQPVYYNDPNMAWEQRLALAYDDATKKLQASLPAGSTIDTSKYAIANEAAGNTVNKYGSDWLPHFKDQTDVDASTALALPSDEMRQYYLGKYADASTGLGAYLSGYAREGIAIGALTQSDFDKGAELRLRAFSEIIYAGNTGSLKALVAGERVASGAAVSKSVQGFGAYPRMSPNATVITIGGSGYSVAPASKLNGFGLIDTAAVVLIIAGMLILSGVVGWTIYQGLNFLTRKQMLDRCTDAVKSKDERAEAICQTMTTVVAQMAKDASPASALDLKGMVGQVVPYAAAGVGALLLIQFAPEIIRSLRGAKKAMQEPEQQIANLARLRKNAARYNKRFAGGW